MDAKTVRKQAPTFILGVGAQKAGTTWLHHYLGKAPTVNTGCLKEYHVWDAVFQPESHPRLTRLVTNPDRPQNAVRRLLQTCPGAYENYFSSLLNERVCITADITPSYSGLSDRNFAEVRHRIERADFSVKVVFLMRDPAQRCWSAAKMCLRNRDLKRREQLSLASKHYLDVLQQDGVGLRTRYERTVTALEGAFQPEQLYFGFYEDMFDPPNVRRLSDFLGVESQPALAGEVVNDSASLPLPGELADSAYREYGETYKFCYARFPETEWLWHRR